MLADMETIISYLKRQLKAAGARRWSAIAAETGCSPNTMRKIAYGDRDNPRVNTVQPLLELFLAVDRHERDLPDALTHDASEPVKASA